MYKNFFKQLIDFFLSLFALVLISPILLIAALLIKLDSKGPVFFLQERLGKDQKIFKVIKFRTMTHIERKVIVQTFKDSPEITGVGKYLRRFKIDELPQLFNVFLGDMAVIGPRPCLLQTMEKFGNADTPYRFKVKPGLSSNAGVNGSIFLTWDEKWWYDKDYVENVSFFLDIQIIVKTILVVIFGEEKFIKKPKI